MKLQDLIEQFIELGVEYEDIESAIKSLGLTSTVLTQKQVADLKAALGIAGDSIHDETETESSGLAEASPKNLEQSTQQIHARDILTKLNLHKEEQQLAAIEGQFEAERKEALRLTRSTAYQATTLQYRIAELQRQKEMLLATQSESDINAFLNELGIANPMSVCSNAVQLAEETLKKIEELQQEKKA